MYHCSLSRWETQWDVPLLPVALGELTRTTTPYRAGRTNTHHCSLPRWETQWDVPLLPVALGDLTRTTAPCRAGRTNTYHCSLPRWETLGDSGMYTFLWGVNRFFTPFINRFANRFIKRFLGSIKRFLGSINRKIFDYKIILFLPHIAFHTCKLQPLCCIHTCSLARFSTAWINGTDYIVRRPCRTRTLFWASVGEHPLVESTAALSR